MHIQFSLWFQNTLTLLATFDLYIVLDFFAHPILSQCSFFLFSSSAIMLVHNWWSALTSNLTFPHVLQCSSLPHGKVFCCLPRVIFLLKTSLNGICVIQLTWQIEGFDGRFVKFDMKYNVYTTLSLFIEHNCCKLKAIFHTGHPTVLVYVSCILHFLKVVWKGKEPIHYLFSECLHYFPITLLFMFHLLVYLILT
jgi:hypothetical protein